MRTNDARAYYWKGEIGRRKTDAEQAELIDDFEHALRLDPSHEKARLALAELYLKAHRQDDAAREYTTHLKTHPDDPEACLGLGQVAAERGQDEEAIRLLDRAMELAPRDPRSLIKRGKLDFRRGKSTSALVFFDKAIEVNPTEPEVHYQRRPGAGSSGPNCRGQGRAGSERPPTPGEEQARSASQRPSSLPQ